MLSMVTYRSRQQKCARSDWNVIIGNVPTNREYQAANTRPQLEWTSYRVYEERLEALAARSPLQFSE